MHKYGFLISEPKKYIATFVTINVGMALVYVFSTKHQYWYLAIIAGFFHLLVLVFMVVLGRVNPGIVPKIFAIY
jgi:hypothetical protein